MESSWPVRLQGILLAFVFVLMIGRAALLWRTQRINPFVIGKGKRGFARLLEILFVAVMLVFVFQVLSISTGSSLRLLPSAWDPILVHAEMLQWLGLGFSFVGLILFAWSLVSFGNSWRVGIDHDQPGQLVTEGAFSWSRNPIYVFLDLYFLGAFLINGTLVFLAFAIVMVAGVHYHILEEEDFLSAHYGEQYRVYRSRVGRYFGRSA